MFAKLRIRDFGSRWAYRQESPTICHYDRMAHIENDPRAIRERMRSLLRDLIRKGVCTVVLSSATMMAVAVLGCTNQREFDAEYRAAITSSTQYPSFDPKYDSPDQLKECVASWKYQGERAANIARLREQGLFDAEKYVFVERACSNGLCYAYTFVALEDAQAILITSSAPSTKAGGNGKGGSMPLDVDLAKELFAKLDNATSNEWQESISQRGKHFYCAFITLKGENTHQFAVIAPFVSSGPNASPPVAVLHHVERLTDQLLGNTGGSSN